MPLVGSANLLVGAFYFLATRRSLLQSTLCQLRTRTVWHRDVSPIESGLADRLVNADSREFKVALTPSVATSMKIIGRGQPTKLAASSASATRRNFRNSRVVNYLLHNLRTPGVGVARSLSNYKSGMNRGLLWAGEIGLARANVIVAVQDFDFDFAIRIRGPARRGVVAQPILRAQLAVDQVEDYVEFLRRVRKKHIAPGSFGDGSERVLAGRITPTLVFYRTNHNGVQQRIGADGFFTRGVKIGAAGGFARIRN